MSRRSSTSCSPTRSGSRDARGDARAGPRRRCRPDRGGADRACRATLTCAAARRVGGSGSSGSAGPGISAYANLARAWGAEVGGWDGVETSYLRGARGHRGRRRRRARRAGRLGGRRLDGVRRPGRRDVRARSSSPSSSPLQPLDRRRGRARQDDDDGDDRVRARASSASIPPGSSAATMPQLGGNAGAGEGWLVVEGDESDRSVERAAPRDRGRHEHRARPPRDVRLGGRGGRRSSSAGSPTVPQVVRGWELEPVGFELAVPGEHNRRNAAAALAALELAGVAARGRRAGARRASAARAGASSSSASAAASRSSTTTRHHPTEIAATIAAARERTERPRARRSSSRTSTRARATSPASSARRSRPADAAVVTDDLPGARGARRGRDRQARRSTRSAPGVRAGWAPTARDRRRARRAAGPGPATSC